VPCGPACEEVLRLEKKVKGYQSQIAAITETIEGILQQDQGKEGTVDGLLSELEALIDSLKRQEPTLSNQNALDVWMIAFFGVALVCVVMLVAMIALSRRKVSVSVKP